MFITQSPRNYSHIYLRMNSEFIKHLHCPVCCLLACQFTCFFNFDEVPFKTQQSVLDTHFILITLYEEYISQGELVAQDLLFVIFNYVHLCVGMRKCPWRPEALGLPAAGVTGSCELPHVDAKNQIPTLCQRRGALIAEPRLQPDTDKIVI